MRIPLRPTLAFDLALLQRPSSGSAPPLVFIDEEPFLIELQGALELPHTGQEGTMEQLAGAHVGKIDIDEPHKPILRISHHRLEGKLVTLTEPYAILRSTASSSHDSDNRPKKRSRISSTIPSSPPPPPSSSPIKPLPSNTDGLDEEAEPPRIEIVGLIRKKIVFSKRPEPMIQAASSDPVGPPTSDAPMGPEDGEQSDGDDGEEL
ncbi:BZ3500_MvSof-1268-A1-R1_Chr11-1g03222 [Microbotryum saponariae]|uniref:BZ3500_MvSof-1268-A1-R1_Chr11-1g03222 protein n=1 Tax=Microbotryum saponariae TaxID=289078 RepID=A0A2X0LB77_9BASI|nr:BZ3501_MvSof-1269-A2-R1_Chr11g02797 [Microbotryum saponariae]SDA03782.1 BZ3500_MvSof-1268-A1-R1_Chr11-1g03222 [Microbotryum saponariae]